MAELEYTDLKQIPEIIADARRAFRTHKTLTYDFRKRQLEQMHRMIADNEKQFISALAKDLRKSKTEALGTEVMMVKSEIVEHIQHLKTWMKGEKPSVKFINKFDNCRIRYDPYGLVLIIGAWNYPVQLTLLPMVGAISAGNCVVLKPSECSAASAEVLARLVPQYLDRDCYKVINGAVDETTLILQQKFDKICYTGGGFVGKIVMKAAAEYLTPVLLELGGKSPCVVDRNCDFDVAARRIVWGRFLNAGQTCIAPDYVLCAPESKGPLLKSMSKAITEFYGKDPQQSPDYCRIINDRQFKRLAGLLENGRVVIGGQTDAKDKYIAPTVLVDPDPESPLLKDEIFGPLLPIVEVGNTKDAIEYINDRDKPLALYVFSNDKSVIDDVLSHTSSGGAVGNDVLMHCSVPELPFGGVGPSGHGSYHGFYSFEAFSHKKSTMVKSLGLEFLNGVRYPPASDSKLNTLRRVMDKDLPQQRSPLASAVKAGLTAAVVAGGLYYFAPGLFSRLTGR